MKYIALLRGVNVGGKNIVSMSALKVAFEQAGAGNVQTYINSGNVLFESLLKKPATIEALTAAITKAFSLSIDVLLYTTEEIIRIAAAIPTDWTNDINMKCDVTFLQPAVDSPAILEKVNVKPGIDHVKYVPGALIWSVNREQVTHSGLLKVIGTPLYKQMTVRNCNTTRKLAVLASTTAPLPSKTFDVHRSL